MTKTVTAKGKTVEEAINNALSELGTSRDRVTTKVIDIPASGLLGMFGTKYAKVEVTMEDEVDNSGSSDSSDIVKKFLGEIFGVMGIAADYEISYDEAEQMMLVDIKSEQTGVIIGKRGATLDALQYLVSLVLNKNSAEYTKVSLDVENYREKRKRALQDLADRIAQTVEKKRSRYVLEPMNPYERRIIHSALQNYRHIITYSEGEEPERHVVIEYKRDKA